LKDNLLELFSKAFLFFAELAGFVVYPVQSRRAI